MKKLFAAAFVSLLASAALVSCDNYNEEAPLTDRFATGYRLPDPETLTDEDRAAIDALQKEYDQHGNEE